MVSYRVSLHIGWIRYRYFNVIFATDIQLIQVRKIITYTSESCFQACYFRHKCPTGNDNLEVETSMD